MKFFSDQLYLYLQSVQAYIAPPIAAVFLLGLFFKRLNARGALAALWTGFFLGLGRLIAELYINRLAPGSWIHTFAAINFLHFAIFLFVLCTAVLVLASLTSPAPNKAQIEAVVYRKESLTLKKAINTPEFWLSLLLLGCIVLLWIRFS